MKFINALTSFLVALNGLAFDFLVQATPLSRRDVIAPRIITPDAGTVWTIGQVETVTWDTSNFPPDSRITNPIGQVILGYLDNSPSLHLDFDHPLAAGFKLRDGSVQLTVPSVEPRDSYIIVLYGDSGNASPAFTIMRITGSSSSSSGLSSSSTSTTSLSSSPSQSTTQLPSSPEPSISATYIQTSSMRSTGTSSITSSSASSSSSTSTSSTTSSAESSPGSRPTSTSSTTHLTVFSSTSSTSISSQQTSGTPSSMSTSSTTSSAESSSVSRPTSTSSTTHLTVFASTSSTSISSQQTSGTPSLTPSKSLFLQNKLLSGLVFTFVGILSFVLIILAIMFFGKRNFKLLGSVYRLPWRG